jgi:hypothetical protein
MNAFHNVQDPDDLEYRLRRIHERQRRAFWHQAIGVAGWSVGLLLMGIFVLALAVSAISK